MSRDLFHAFMRWLGWMPRADLGDNYQPMPLDVSLCRDDNGHTSIARTWRAADVPLCRLCPAGHCCANPVGEAPQDSRHAYCLIVVRAHVRTADAVLFRNARPRESN